MSETTIKDSKALEDLDVNALKNAVIKATDVTGGDSMILWSDEKKADFCKTFDDRVRVSVFILVRTAEKLGEVATRRQFLGSRALNKVQTEFRGIGTTSDYDSNRFHDPKDYNHLGGRNLTELNQIADERAEEIFKNLPPLKQAVQLIKPDVAAKIDRIDKLKEQIKPLADLLDSKDFAEDLRMSEVDQNMTIAAFRTMVKERVKRRRQLVDKVNELSKEAIELEDAVAKALFGGIPELGDAIVEVIRTHYERALALEQMGRRVPEQVKFGDSKAATDLVKRFEADEKTISSSVKDEFDAALNRLKLSRATVKKAFNAKKKEKKS